MKEIHIEDIRENTSSEGVFLVLKKREGKTRRGDPFLSLTLGDRTGEIEAKIWDRAVEMSKLFEKNDLIWIQSRAEVYQDRLQLVIADLRPVDENEIDPGDFLPKAERDPEEMFQDLRTQLRKVKDVYLKALLKSYLQDKDLMERFKRAPAAKRLHHVYIGGLLEHTLSLLRLVDQVAPLYPEVNPDLLRAGAFLHDMGKVFELSYSRGFDYTTEGRLLGHIVQGLKLLDEKMSDVEGFPDLLALHLKHLIISHHGEYEYGSPRRPKTLEALLFYYIDNLDAKMIGVGRFISQQEGEDPDWTSHHGVFGRPFYRHSYMSLSDPDPSGRLKEEKSPPDNVESQELPLFASRTDEQA
ncbi:MAG: HD domain-containing protein [Deltaproteobacteria bacterium]|nr:HD domain-containing protein [Deltaproteobacteria bacterium]MBW2305854.1 HD domain-containing protein [Deltaproteobacteria bacterium]